MGPHQPSIARVGATATGACHQGTTASHQPHLAASLAMFLLRCAVRAACVSIDHIARRDCLLLSHLSHFPWCTHHCTCLFCWPGQAGAPNLEPPYPIRDPPNKQTSKLMRPRQPHPSPMPLPNAPLPNSFAFPAALALHCDGAPLTKEPGNNSNTHTAPLLTRVSATNRSQHEKPPPLEAALCRHSQVQTYRHACQRRSQQQAPPGAQPPPAAAAVGAGPLQSNRP